MNRQNGSATAQRWAVGERAWRWHTEGACPVPVRDDGSKAPAGRWKGYQAAQPTEAEMVKAFGSRAAPWRSTGFGLVLRDGLECLETEDLATEARFVASCLAAGFGDLLDRVTHGYADRGPGGGVHRIYRVAGDERAGNTKLARRREFSPKEARKLAEHGRDDTSVETNETATLIETRGVGGFIICAPSGSPTLHPGKATRYATRSEHTAGRESHARVPAGRSYQDISGSPETVATISHDEREALCAVAHTLDEMPKVVEQHYRDSADMTRTPGAMTLGGWFNQAVTWRHVMVDLLGWYPAGQGESGEQHWLRPGDTSSAKSATSDHLGNGHLTVFSTSVEWAGDPKPGKAAPSYDKFGVMARALHQGDFTAATRWVHASYDLPASVGWPGGPAVETSPATPAEVEQFLDHATRCTRPDALGRRVAWMTRDGAHRRHVNALVAEAARGYYPARRAMHVLRQTHGQPPGTDPAGADRRFAGALGVLLERTGATS